MRDRRTRRRRVAFCLRLYLLSGLLYGGSVCVFVSQKHSLHLGASFFAEAIALYAVILVVHLVGLVRRCEQPYLSLLSLQMVCSLLIGYPLGGDAASRILLYSSILLISANLRAWAAAFLISGSYLFLTVLSLRTLVAWGIVVPGPDAGQRILAGVVETAFAVVGFSFRSYHERLAEMRRETEREVSVVSQLTLANEGFQNYANTAVHQSLAAERRRISRDLHDSFGYALTNIRMLMEEAIRLYQGPSHALGRLLVEARDLALQTMDEARSTLKELRASQDGQRKPGLPAVLRMVQTFRDSTHMIVDLHASNSKLSYGEAVDACVYRLVQEALTNSLRHGKATAIRIHLFQDGSRLLLSISDNGNAGDEVAEGIGLSGMKERVLQLGGSVSYSRTNSGFRVDAFIPVESATRRFGVEQ